jgi:hypothetical protein
MPRGRRPGAEHNLGEEVTPGYWSPRRTLSVMDADGALLLLREILADLPRLHGASCVGQYALFDPVVDNGRRHRDQERARLAKTATICATCPVRAQCISVTVAVTVEVIPAPRRRPAPPPGVLSLGTAS